MVQISCHAFFGDLNLKSICAKHSKIFFKSLCNTYFETFSAPTIETLFLLVLSMRSLYKHFLSGITGKTLNAFYYACSYAKVDYSRFMNVTAAMALKLIPDALNSQPVFLCIDDTMVSKFGKKFEDVSKLFDHASGCFLSHSAVLSPAMRRRFAAAPEK